MTRPDLPVLGQEGPTNPWANQLNSAINTVSDTADNALTAATGAQAQQAALTTLDITKTRPTFLTSLQLASGNVMQCCVKEPETGDFYVSQARSDGVPNMETTIITRVSSAGVLLDSMTLTNGGHGTTIGLQRIAGATHIWLAWQDASPAGNTNDLVRFQYRPGATLGRSEESFFTLMPKFGGGYVIVAFDLANDWVAYRTSGGTSDVYTRRKLSEVLANVDRTYGTVPLTQGVIGSTTITMQGFCTIDDSLYRYTGDTNAATNPTLITRYDWATGGVTGQIDTGYLGVNPDGTVPGGFREPEGISIYRDPTTGRASMLAGVTTGPVGGRQYRMFLLAPIGADHFAGTQIQTFEAIIPVTKSGAARRIPSGVTTMTALTSPGWYYMTAAEYSAMTDRPSNWLNSGHWLEVAGYDSSKASTIQRLIRNTTTGLTAQYIRCVDLSPTGAKNLWYQVNMTSQTYV